MDLSKYYQLPQLLVLLERQLLQTLAVQNVADRLLLGVRYSLDDLRVTCVKILKQNTAAVMATEGWAKIASDHTVMSVLLCSPDESAERDPKRQRKGG